MKITTEMLRTRLAAVEAGPTPTHETCMGKWGHYPCQWATYQKLRLLNCLAMLSKRQEATYDRWSRKLPENRLIRRRNGERLNPPLPLPEPPVDVWFNDHDIGLIWTDYRNARFPKAAPEEVSGLQLSPPKIDTMLTLAAQQMGVTAKEVA